MSAPFCCGYARVGRRESIRAAPQAYSLPLLSGIFSGHGNDKAGPLISFVSACVQPCITVPRIVGEVMAPVEAVV